MKQRTLGGSGIAVSAIGLGCYGLSGAYGTSDDDAAIQVIQHAIGLGVTLLNTSDTYGAGHNEQLIGRAMRGRRDQVVLCTKFGNPGRDADNKPIGVCGRPEYVPIACERSLKRLGVDHIDVYELHRVDPTVPIEDTVAAMARLVQQGKVRAIGLSEASAATVRRAHAVHKLAVLETEYSLWSRGPEAELLPTCRALGIGFMAYSPLGRGFLAGAVDTGTAFATSDPRSVMPRFQADNLAANLGRLQRLRALAQRKGCDLGQLALAWLLARGDDIVPIPGTRRIAHLEQNLGALSVALNPDDMAALDEILPAGGAAGERYDDAYLRTIEL